MPHTKAVIVLLGTTIFFGCSVAPEPPSTLNNTVFIQQEQKQKLSIENVIDTLPIEVELNHTSIREAYKVANVNSFANGNFAVIDYRLHSAKPRLFLFSSTDGFILSSFVSHGIRSGRAYANDFSDRLNSNMSPAGFLLGAEAYVGKNGYSMRIDGMEPQNKTTRLRNIRLHPSDYATEQHIAVNKMLGRSDGCLAVQPELSKTIIKTLKNGGVLYLYHDGVIR